MLTLLFMLPLSMMAQEDITIVENGESQPVRGTLITISDTEEYIDTPTKLYQVTGTNTTMLGDLVKDNFINVADVTTMVDMVLNQEFSKLADLNKDNNVNIADLTTEVDIALDDGIGEVIVESYEVEDITDTWIKSNTATAVDQH